MPKKPTPPEVERLDPETALREMDEALYTRHLKRMEPFDRHAQNDPIPAPLLPVDHAQALWIDHADSLTDPESPVPEHPTGPID